MPKTKVNTPDGGTITVEHPEGATQDQILRFAQQQYSPPESKAPPTLYGGIGDLSRAATGLGDVGLTMASGLANRMKAGIGGALAFQEGIGPATEAFNALQGQTRQPVTPEGQNLAAGLARLGEPVETFLTDAGGAVPGGPVAQTIARTAMQAPLEALALRGGLNVGRGVAQSATQGATSAASSIPLVRDLFSAGGEAFQTASKLGATLKPEAMTRFGSRIANLKQANGKPELFDPRLHPKAFYVKQTLLDDAAQGNLSYDRLMQLRQLASDAALSLEKGDSRLGVVLLKEIDDFVGNPNPKDFSGGAPVVSAALLKEGRDLWRRASKAEQIERMIKKAELKGKAQFTGAGEEQAIRAQFRALAEKISDGKERGWTKAEIAAIERVANGGPVGNVFRELGKNAPTGIVSSGIGAGVGFQLFGPLGAVAVPAAGLVGRRLATQATQRNAANVSQLIRSGGLLGP